MDGDDDLTVSAMIDDPMSNGAESASPATAAMGEPMDVEAYAAMYTGRTKIIRLLFIADNCDNEAMKLEALRMAYDEIKKGEDTNLHREVSSKIRNRLGPKYTVDNAWVESVEKRAAMRRDKLDNELNGYRVHCWILLLFFLFTFLRNFVNFYIWKIPVSLSITNYIILKVFVCVNFYYGFISEFTT